MSGNAERILSESLYQDMDFKMVAPHIYSVLPDVDAGGSYDTKFGDLYDRVACNPLYNLLIWGYSTSRFALLIREALESSGRGSVLDAGCGSLAFTARTYARYSERPVVFLDRSLKLLKVAVKRISKMHGDVPSNRVFLHADAFHLPFRADSFETVISLNLLHVLGDPETALLGMKRVLDANGHLYLTTLVENNRMSDRYLRMWERKGEVVSRNIFQVKAVLDGLKMSARCDVVGNMAFLFCTK